MEIGDWPATEGLNNVMRTARELGIERHLLELEAFGFTVVEPFQAAPEAFFQRMRDAVFSRIESEDPTTVHINTVAKQGRPAQGRQLFHLLKKDDVFIEALLNPYTLTFAHYLMGCSARLYSTVAFFKSGQVGTTLLHNDSTGMPGPLPHYGNVCNISWVLTDYTKENGTFFMVPGSHRQCRHPTDMEQPQMMGGPAPDDRGLPVNAPAGSLIVFHGNTWHGTFPKTSDGKRAHVALALCRNYVNPAEDYDDISETRISQFGPQLARLIGKTNWQGYRTEGPELAKMGAVRSAQWNQYS